MTKNEIPHIGSGVVYGGNSIAAGSGWKDTWLGSGDLGQAHNNMPPYLVVYIYMEKNSLSNNYIIWLIN